MKLSRLLKSRFTAVVLFSLLLLASTSALADTIVGSADLSLFSPGTPNVDFLTITNLTGSGLPGYPLTPEDFLNVTVTYNNGGANQTQTFSDIPGGFGTDGFQLASGLTFFSLTGTIMDNGHLENIHGHYSGPALGDSDHVADITVTTPEPASLSLFGIGVTALGVLRRRKR